MGPNEICLNCFRFRGEYEVCPHCGYVDGTPPKEALSIIGDVLTAVESIHKKNIIHRDISPDNIFILFNGSVKVLDFGAARFAVDENPAFTQSIVIKMGYAPPEQYCTVPLSVLQLDKNVVFLDFAAPVKGDKAQQVVFEYDQGYDNWKSIGGFDATYKTDYFSNASKGKL